MSELAALVVGVRVGGEVPLVAVGKVSVATEQETRMDGSMWVTVVSGWISIPKLCGPPALSDDAPGEVTALAPGRLSLCRFNLCLIAEKISGGMIKIVDTRNGEQQKVEEVTYEGRDILCLCKTDLS